MTGCFALGHPIQRSSCASREHCERIAAVACNNRYTIRSVTIGDPDDEEWDHDGFTPAGNVLWNMIDAAATAMSSTPWVVVYYCN